MTAARPALARLLLAGLVGLAASGGAARAAGAEADTYAVVIGWNGGTRDLPPLRFADDDAVRFTLFLRGMAPTRAPAAIRLLTAVDDDTRATLARAGLVVSADGPPTRDAVLAAFADLARTLAGQPRAASAARRRLYVVYAGHGLEGRVLLQPTEGTEAGLTGAELRAALTTVAAAAPDLEILVFLDACRAQSLFSERGADGAGPDLGDAITALEQRSARLSIGVLTAARSGRPAGEVRRLGAGFFSHVLTSGLAGAADADGNDVVTFGELAAFVAFHTERLTGQMPWFAPPDGNLDSGAIDHRGRPGRLVIPAAEAGRYLVGAPGGLPVFAEAFKRAGRSLKLALPPGRYRVVHEGAGASSVAAIDLRGASGVDSTDATWSAPAVGARGDEDELGAEKGEDPRFAFRSPFSEEVVSTLAAGFHAGREPAPARRWGAHEISAGLGVGAAPLQLPGAEPGFALAYRRRVGPAFVGATFFGGASSHHTAAGAYELRRLAFGPQLGWTVFASRGFELSLELAAGWGSVLRSSGGMTTGDLLAPFAAAGGRAALRLGDDGWFAALAGRALVQWVQVDGRRTGSAGPQVGLLAGRAF